MAFKNTYKIDSLSCPNCSMNIVEALEKLTYIDEVYIDYDTKNITITGSKSLSEEQVKEVINYILNTSHCDEHDLVHLHNIVTEEFNFADIDCPNCANKVERALNKETDIIEATVNFINKKIIIKHLNNVEVYDVVSKIVKKVESHAKVFKEDNNHAHEHKHDHPHQHTHHHTHSHDCNHEHENISCGFTDIGCDCCSSYEEYQKLSEPRKKWRLGLNILGLTIFILFTILNIINPKDIYRFGFIIAYLLIGYDILYKSFKGILSKDFFNENFLMVIASCGALAINESIEAVLVILLYKIGEFYQNKATEKSKNSIKSLMELQPETVTLSTGEIKNIKEVNVGEVISVKVGEKIPLDGVVINGYTDVDMKALTGESKAVYIDKGQEILSGSVNLTKVIEVEVTKVEGESTISKVLKLVMEASNQKSKTEQFITRFARYYTPIVLLFALLVGLFQLFILKEDLNISLNKIFSILVISCPCALVISVPLGYFAGIGRSSASGILVKGGSFLDALSNVETFVFDKTGTITKGNFKVSNIYSVDGVTEGEVLKTIANVERFSKHPIAQAIINAYGDSINNVDEKFDIEEIGGLGLKVKSSDKEILVGNATLLQNNNIDFVESKIPGTVIYLSVNSKFLGYICIKDEIKEEAKLLVSKLNKYYKTMILTGDNEDIAKSVCNEVGIKEVKSQLLPKEKYEILKAEINQSKKNVVFVGDGINDTPAIKLADIGIAMGGVGSDQAKECADIVIMNDDLNKIYEGVKIAKYTKRTVIQNIVMALGIKFAAIIAGVFNLLGSYTMIAAVFADVGVCLIAILNTMKILKMKYSK